MIEEGELELRYNLNVESEDFKILLLGKAVQGGNGRSPKQEIRINRTRD